MINEKKRILKCFHALINNDFLSSYELAKIVGVTNRTIKTDIMELEIFAKASGANIISKKGLGYKLIITDEEIFEPIKYQLNILYAYQEMEIQNRTNDILRRIIVENSDTTIDDIIEELYWTKSAIKEELKTTREILKAYNMSIARKGESGYLIKGNEFNRRSLMLYIFEMHYHEGLTLYTSEKYSSYFLREEEERYEIRHILLKVLRDFNIHIIDDYTQLLSRYLCLMSSRFQEGFTIKLEHKQISWIKKFNQYAIAEEVIRQLQDFEGFEVNEEEVAALALYFLFFADIMKDSKIEEEYAPIYKEVRTFSKQCLRMIKEEFNVDVINNEENLKYLISVFIPIFIQNKFGCIAHIVKSTESSLNRLIEYPIEFKLAHQCSILFEKEHNAKMALISIIKIADKFRIMINNLKINSKALKLALCSKEGIDSSKVWKSFIEKQFQGNFSSIDCFELYEVRKVNPEDYDLAIINLSQVFYKYQIPSIYWNTYPCDRQIYEFQRKIVTSKINFDSLVKLFDINEITVYKNFRFQDVSSFLQLISFKMGKDSKSIEELHEDLKQLAHCVVLNKIALIQINYKYVNNDIFEIYQLSALKQWHAKEIEAIVIMSLDLKNDVEYIKIMRLLIITLCQDLSLASTIIGKSLQEQLKIILDSDIRASLFHLN